MDDFQALITSLGESTVAYLGMDQLRSLDIMGDELDGNAYLQICLREDTWDSQTRAVEKMLEIREMFFDELSIDYRFIDEDSATRTAIDAQEKRATSYTMV